MKVNERLRNAIFEVIDNQINANDPAETALTLERLVNEGYSDFQAKQLIGQAVVIEVIDALKNKKPYNEQRYIKNLRDLPQRTSGIAPLPQPNPSAATSRFAVLTRRTSWLRCPSDRENGVCHNCRILFVLFDSYVGSLPS